MAFLECRNVRIAGMAAGVPKTIVTSDDGVVVSKDYDASDFVAATGIKERRLGPYTTSDLCFAAAERLLSDLGWNRGDVDALVLVTQTPDYNAPATSCILQDRLGLSRNCYTLDISLGCSGWVYGLSSVAALLSCGHMKRALLMVGDAKKRVPEQNPLIGNAGTVTALEYVEGVKGFQFHFGTDGSGFDAIVIPDGGARNQMTPQSFEEEEVDGRMLNRLQSHMKGMDVFSFAITTAPKSVKQLARHFEFDYQECDYFVFHQANKMMNDLIVKKLKLDADKVPSCMYHFGNTSSASIPLTMVTQLRGKVEKKPTRFMCCGFGIGLSWGSVAFDSEDMLISELVELDNYQVEPKYIV